MVATKSDMRLEEINGRLFSEVSGYREKKGSMMHRVTQTYKSTNEIGVQCAIGAGMVNATQKFINHAQKTYK